MQSRNAISNLISRYRAVLKKCNLLNTFGTLAMASMLVMGGVNVASAAVVDWDGNGNATSTTGEYKLAGTVDLGVASSFLSPDNTVGSEPNVSVTLDLDNKNFTSTSSLTLQSFHATDDNTINGAGTITVNSLDSDRKDIATGTVSTTGLTLNGVTVNTNAIDATDLTLSDGTTVNIKSNADYTLKGGLTLDGNTNSTFNYRNSTGETVEAEGIDVGDGENISLGKAGETGNHTISSTIHLGTVGGTETINLTVNGVNGASGTTHTIGNGRADININSANAKLDVQSGNLEITGYELKNAGTIGVSGGATLTTDATLKSTGTLNISGTLDVDDSAEIAANTNVTVNGELDVANTLTFTGGAVNIAGTGTINAKNLKIEEGTYKFGNTTTGDSLAVTDSVGGDGTIGDLTLNSSVTLNGLATTGNAITGTKVTVGSTGNTAELTLNYVAPASPATPVEQNISANLETSADGTINVAAGTWNVGATNTLTNNGSLDVAGDLNILNTGTGLTSSGGLTVTGALDVTGTLHLSGPSYAVRGTGTINAGDLKVDEGTTLETIATVTTDSLTVNNTDGGALDDFTLKSTVEVNGLATDADNDGIADSNAITGGKIIIDDDASYGLNLNNTTNPSVDQTFTADIENLGAGKLTVTGNWSAANSDLTTKADNLDVKASSNLTLDTITFESNTDQTLNMAGTVIGNTLTVDNSAGEVKNLNVNQGKITVNGGGSGSTSVTADTITLGSATGTGLFTLGANGGNVDADLKTTIDTNSGNLGVIGVLGSWTTDSDSIIDNDGVLNLVSSTLTVNNTNNVDSLDSTGGVILDGASSLDIKGNAKIASDADNDGGTSSNPNYVGFVGVNTGSTLNVDGTLYFTGGNVGIKGQGAINAGNLKLDEGTYKSETTTTADSLEVVDGADSGTDIGNLTLNSDVTLNGVATGKAITGTNITVGSAGSTAELTLEYVDPASPAIPVEQTISSSLTTFDSKGTITVADGTWNLGNAYNVQNAGNMTIAADATFNAGDTTTVTPPTGDPYTEYNYAGIFQNTGTLTVNGDLVVNNGSGGNFAFQSSGNLNISGTVDIAGNAEIAGNKLNLNAAGSSLIVDGKLTFTDTETTITYSEDGFTFAGTLDAGSKDLNLTKGLIAVEGTGSSTDNAITAGNIVIGDSASTDISAMYLGIDNAQNVGNGTINANVEINSNVTDLSGGPLGLALVGGEWNMGAGKALTNNSLLSVLAVSDANTSLNIDGSNYTHNGAIFIGGDEDLSDPTQDFTATINIANDFTIDADKFKPADNFTASTTVEGTNIYMAKNSVFHADNLILNNTDTTTDQSINTNADALITANTLKVVDSDGSANLHVVQGTLKVIGDDSTVNDVEASTLVVGQNDVDSSSAKLVFEGDNFTSEDNIIANLVTLAGTSADNDGGVIEIVEGEWSLGEGKAISNEGQINITTATARLNIAGARKFNTSDFAYSASAADGKITNSGTLHVDTLVLESDSALNTNGTITSNTLDVVDSSGARADLISNTKLQVFGATNAENVAIFAGDLTLQSSLSLGPQNFATGVVGAEKELPTNYKYIPAGGVIDANITTSGNSAISVNIGDWTLAENKTFEHAGTFGLTVQEKATLDTSNGNLKVSNGFFDNDGRLIAKASDFGTFTVSGGDIAGTDLLTGNVTRLLVNDGILELVGLTGEVEYKNLLTPSTNIADIYSSLLNSTSTNKNIYFSGLNTTGVSGLSLDQITTNGISFDSNETVGAGALGSNMIIKVAGLTQTDPTAPVNSSVATGATLTLSGVNGAVLMEGDATTNLTNNGTVNLGTAGGSADFGGGKFTNVFGAGTNIMGTVSNVFELDNDGIVYIGDSGYAGHLEVETETGNGVILLDPAWNIVGNNIGSGSKLILNDGTITNTIGVGNASYMAIGNEASSVYENDFRSAYLEFGDPTAPSASGNEISAALFIDKATDLTGGYLLVDGTLDHASFVDPTDVTQGVNFFDGSVIKYAGITSSGDAVFAANSLVVINDTLLGANPALSVGNLTVDATSKLLLTDIGALSGTTVGAGIKTIDIVDETGAIVSGWTDANIMFDSAFHELDITATDYNDIVAGGTGEIEITQVAANSVMPLLDSGLAAHIDQGIFEGALGAGMDFVKQASLMPGDDRRHEALVIESAAKMAVLSGVYGHMNNISDMYYRNVVDRVSFAKVAKGDADISGFGIWAAPMYQNSSIDGLDSGSFDYGYDSDIAGMAIGVDYTLPSNTIFGANFHLGAGDSESNGDFAKTDNDFDYIGIGVYAAHKIDNFGVSADLGVSWLSNEVDQSNPLGRIEGDFDSSIISAGLRLEYEHITDAVDIVPYAGIRFNIYDTDSFDSHYAGTTIMKNSSEDATVFTIPIGVTLSKDIVTESGFIVNPSLDLGVKFAMGDTDIEQTVNVVGISNNADMNVDVLDPVTFQGGLGLGVAKGMFNFDLDYNLDASRNVLNHGVMGTFSFKF